MQRNGNWNIMDKTKYKIKLKLLRPFPLPHYLFIILYSGDRPRSLQLSNFAFRHQVVCFWSQWPKLFIHHIFRYGFCNEGLTCLYRPIAHPKWRIFTTVQVSLGRTFSYPCASSDEFNIWFIYSSILEPALPFDDAVDRCIEHSIFFVECTRFSFFCLLFSLLLQPSVGVNGCFTEYSGVVDLERLCVAAMDKFSQQVVARSLTKSLTNMFFTLHLPNVAQ